MEAAVPDSPLAERILSAEAPVVVVRGPAGCGKTSAALTLYRHDCPAATARPGCLLLAPNFPAVQYLRRLITAGSPGGVAVAPAAMTFAALAGRILLDSGVTERQISPFQRRLLLAQVVDELLSVGRLAALGAVADTPGLVVALDRAIAEIKRAAVEPDDLDRAVGKARDRRGDLAAVYRRYQQQLADRGLYDVEGQAWLAREKLRQALRRATGDLPGLAGVRTIVADGFTDFTPTQLAILEAAARRLDRVVITLPHADDSRRRMWHWTDRTLATIRERFGDRLTEMKTERPHAEDAEDAERTGKSVSFSALSAPSARSPNPFRGLWDSVFDIDASRTPPPGLSVIAAAGMDSEVAAVARRVKRLLVDGAPAGKIAVLARSLEAYEPTIRRVFADHEIPLAPRAEPLTEAPVVRFALAVAALSPELAWNDVLHVIRAGYFRPGALGPFDERTVAAAEMLIRAGNVQSGRASYAEAARRLAARAERAAAENEDDDGADAPHVRQPSPDEYRQAGDMLQRLFDVSAAASQPAGLGAIVRELDLPAAALACGEPGLVARDLRALAALEDHLACLPHPAPRTEHVLRALSAATCPPARGESLVDVLDVLDARATRYDHVFVLGVSERMFPPPSAESPLVGEADRTAWRARGVQLDSRSDLTAREMLLFYLAITRADATLTLSYLAADSGGRVGSPSSFLLAAGAAVGGLDAVLTERIAPGPYIPPDGDMASTRDALCAGLAGLVGGETPVAPRALAWAARSAPHALRAGSRGIYAAHRRWLGGEYTEYDGRITDKALLADLGRRYPAGCVFSAARLDAFGQCPWLYFAKYILRLAPAVEPQRRLEPTARGVFCHNVLFRLMRSLAGERRRPVCLADVPADALSAALDEAVAAEADAVEATAPPYPVLWQIQRERMRRDLAAYLAEAKASALPARAVRFELSFGLPIDADQPHDDSSTPEPVTVRTPAGEILLRGRIDRVDRVRFEDTEGLLVVDYKTGRLPGEKDVLEGRNLQMPLYAAAVASLLGEKCLGGAFHGIGGAGKFERLFAAIKAGRGKAPYKLDDGYDEKHQAAMETVGRFLRQMAAGEFFVSPTDRCPSYCPLRRICQYSPVRARRKAAPSAAEGREEPS